MGIHADLIAADLDGIDPQKMAEHFRAVASLTAQQIQGMLGWAQQAQDPDVYRLAANLSGDNDDLPWTGATSGDGSYENPWRYDPLPVLPDPDAPPCLDCGKRLPLDVPAYAVDCGGVCEPCGLKRYGDRAPEYLIA